MTSLYTFMSAVHPHRPKHKSEHLKMWTNHLIFSFPFVSFRLRLRLSLRLRLRLLLRLRLRLRLLLHFVSFRTQRNKTKRNVQMLTMNETRHEGIHY